LSGLEPETSRLSGVCSNHLSYKPIAGSVARHHGDRDDPVSALHLSIGGEPPGWQIEIRSAMMALIGYRRPDQLALTRPEDPLKRIQLPPILPAECRQTGQRPMDIPRKEVIQPHLPIRLPCYDLVPLTASTFGASLLAVGTTTSGEDNSGGLTGGVYKAQEHIHRGVADPRLLAIPASCGRIAAHNPN
jgi:hypothetical protein